MALVYWFSDGVGEGVNKGGADGKTPVPTALVRWIRTKGAPALIVYGGDVYPAGNSKSFSVFLEQMDADVTLVCETAGNHDWQDDPDLPVTGRIPHGYDTFWRNHPESKQSVDNGKKGSARYDHFIDIDGWRLIFVDTGDNKNNPWPAGDPSRVTWLMNTFQPGRANILLAHHSRLSRGRHGDNDNLDQLWKTLFDSGGVPRVAFTLAGHDHNVSMYGPRSRNNPKGTSVPFAEGIHLFVNGAGGDGHYSHDGFLFFGGAGTKPDLFGDDDNFCVTRINLISPTAADVDVLDFGRSAKGDPKPIDKSLVRIRL